MALFVCSNGAAYLRQLQVPVLFGLSGCIPMGDERCPLLERGVDETEVRVVFRFGVLAKNKKKKKKQS